MKRIFRGVIKEVYKNFGILETKIEDTEVELFFYIFPSMLYKNKKLIITKEVDFEIRTSQVRGTKMKLAYNLKCVEGEPKKKYFISSIQKKLIITDYHQYIFKTFFKLSNDEYLYDVIEIDRKFKEFCLENILFLESEMKKLLVKVCMKADLNEESIYSILENNTSTKKIREQGFKTLKNRYEFRKEFELFSIKEKNEDKNDFELVSAPFIIFLEILTLDELSKVVNIIYKSIKNKVNYDYSAFLDNTNQIFSELSIIRNASAHGNPLIPLILDDNYNPNHYFDMKSVYPSFNSGDNIEEQWELFDFIRFSTRQLYKQGIYVFNAGSPQMSALYFTKYLFSNPSRRSFFSLFFVMMCYFEFISSDFEDQFWNNAKHFIKIPEGNKENELENLLNRFPNKENAVSIQFLRLMYPLLAFGIKNNNMFRTILGVSKK